MVRTIAAPLAAALALALVACGSDDGGSARITLPPRSGAILVAP